MSGFWFASSPVGRRFDFGLRVWGEELVGCLLAWLAVRVVGWFLGWLVCWLLSESLLLVGAAVLAVVLSIPLNPKP